MLGMKKMKIRIGLARFFIRLGRFIQTLAVPVMRPDDLIRFSQDHYSLSQSIQGWTADILVDTWLTPDEKILLEKIPLKKGTLLLLGMGGGREAIPLAKKGFEVTGIDFVSGMVERATENASRHGLKINGLVQDISRLNVPSGSFDLVWFSGSMYSCIPTRKRRIAMLKKIHATLKPGGICLCQGHLSRDNKRHIFQDAVLKSFAWLTLGHLQYESGDKLWGNTEFVHEFFSLNEMKSELNEAGFFVSDIHVYEAGLRAGVILKKSASYSSTD